MKDPHLRKDPIMDLNNLIRTAAGVASFVIVGVAIKNHNHVIKTERAKRVAIALETEKEIRAIRRAGRVVEAKILRGDYDRKIMNGRVLSAIRQDQEFYRIAARIND